MRSRKKKTKRRKRKTPKLSHFDLLQLILAGRLVWCSVVGRVLKDGRPVAAQSANWNGYPRATVWSNGRWCNGYHVLVWMVVNRSLVPPEHEIDHVNRDRQDFSPGNLVAQLVSEHRTENAYRRHYPDCSPYPDSWDTVLAGEPEPGAEESLSDTFD